MLHVEGGLKGFSNRLAKQTVMAAGYFNTFAFSIAKVSPHRLSQGSKLGG
ncbi:MAG: hypothetical protein ACTSWP_07685 [Candidatus Freyarchaeota archaeon]